MLGGFPVAFDDLLHLLKSAAMRGRITDGVIFRRKKWDNEMPVNYYYVTIIISLSCQIIAHHGRVIDLRKKDHKHDELLEVP